MDWCVDATVEKTPSHRSQCGGFAVSQNSNAQSSHAHTRCRFLPFILLTINDCDHADMHSGLERGLISFLNGLWRFHVIRVVRRRSDIMITSIPAESGEAI